MEWTSGKLPCNSYILYISLPGVYVSFWKLYHRQINSEYMYKCMHHEYTCIYYRDIKKIHNTAYNTNIVNNPECRCPLYYADLVPNDPEGRLCRSPVTPSQTSARLRTTGHYPVFAIDGNSATTWRSRDRSAANPTESLTITLEQIYSVRIAIKLYLAAMIMKKFVQ